MTTDLFYEIRPYFYVAIALTGIFQAPESTLTKVFGALLIFCSIMIMHWRSAHRKYAKNR